MSSILPASATDPASWAAQQTVQAAEKARVETANVTSPLSSGRPMTNKAKEAGQQFEALYLRQMIEEFMPKDSEALFGKGTSGTVWRSMLADSLATTISKSGTIGLAKMVIKPQTTPEAK